MTIQMTIRDRERGLRGPGLTTEQQAAIDEAAGLSAAVEGLQGTTEDLQASTADLQTVTGDPVIYPQMGDWERVELDANDRFSSGRTIDGAEYAARSHAISRVAERPWAFPYVIRDWKELTLDVDDRVERGIDKWGLVWEPRASEIVPVGNTGQLLCAAAYGDSTTYGDELANRNAERWTKLLGTELGIPIWNRGANGQTAAQITGRAGGYRPTASVTGGSIPASGPVALTNISVADVLTGYTYDRLWDVMTDDGSRIRGVLTRVDASSCNFTRLDAGDAKAAATVDLISITGRDDLAAHSFIGMGINDEPDTGANTALDDVKAHYRALTTACKGGFTIWGMLDRGLGETSGNMTFILAVEAWLRQQYGSFYCPVRSYLTSARALADAAIVQPGFAPTTDDNDAVAAGRTPPSFRFAGVHLNALGHKLQARFMARYLRARFNV